MRFQIELPSCSRGVKRIENKKGRLKLKKKIDDHIGINWFKGLVMVGCGGGMGEGSSLWGMCCVFAGALFD